MPIDASPSGTLDIENATLRSRNIASLTNMVAGNDVIRGSAAPTLEVYGDPSNDGGVLPTLEIVSNVNAAGSAFTRLTSNAGVFSIQSGTAGTTDSKGDIAFTSIGGDTEHMRIQGSSGNVGIGTDNPGTKLSVYDISSNLTAASIITKGGSSANQPSFSILDMKDAVGAGGYIKGFHNPYVSHGIQFGSITGNSRNTELMTILDIGNVGIGTANPRAKLTVIGDGDIATASGMRRYFSYNDAMGTIAGYWNPASIYGSGPIVSGSHIASVQGAIGASDERIKKDITDVDDGSALETLRLLKPKKYKYKDVINRGDEPVWGFIAQEVGATLPYTTQLRTECIPNIYELANVSDSNVITFTNFDTSTLESNAMVLKVYDIDDTEHLVNIAEVVDEHTVRVDEDLSEWIGTVEGSEGDKIFVYGQEVDDFVFLKKEAIFTVATAALQEVDRQLQAEKAKVTTLETQLTSVLARLDALEGA